MLQIFFLSKNILNGLLFLVLCCSHSQCQVFMLTLLSQASACCPEHQQQQKVGQTRASLLHSLFNWNVLPLCHTGRETSPLPQTDSSSKLQCIVRVVTVDRSASVTSSPWQSPALAVLAEHGLVGGHALVPTELRRQLNLDATGCVWVKTGSVSVRQLGAIILYPISVVVSSLPHTFALI